jgi:hypothetical protein
LLLLKGREMFLPSLPEERASEIMGAEKEGNGLTLEGLALRLETQAQKLETLERENEKMRSENDALQSKVATLEGSQMPPGDEEEPARALDGRVSRRRLLRSAGAAAVGTMAAGALLARDASVAKADHFGPGISVDYVITHLEGTNLTAVFGNAPNGEGVVGFGNANGVRGVGKAGVVGKSSTTGWEGVYGQHTGSGYGVVGDGSGNTFAGVLGRNPSGPGVRGKGSIGVWAEGPTGVWAEGWVGVRGVGRRDVKGGYGGQFSGDLAQLHLFPMGTVGKPTTDPHTKGEIYMDSEGTLFVCTANGTPGTWRKVTTTAV